MIMKILHLFNEVFIKLNGWFHASNLLARIFKTFLYS